MSAPPGKPSACGRPALERPLAGRLLERVVPRRRTSESRNEDCCPPIFRINVLDRLGEYPCSPAEVNGCVLARAVHMVGCFGHFGTGTLSLPTVGIHVLHPNHDVVRPRRGSRTVCDGDGGVRTDRELGTVLINLPAPTKPKAAVSQATASLTDGYDTTGMSTSFGIDRLSIIGEVLQMVPLPFH